MAIFFETQIEKYGRNGEKTGWTYILLDTHLAEQINPVKKISYRVKGFLDKVSIHGASILPIGNGQFILPLNLTLRKLLKKKAGDTVLVNLSLDESQYSIDDDFVDCLSAEKEAYTFFKNLPESHQKYFSKWIQTARTSETKANRIAGATIALSRKMGYGEMIRSRRREKL